MKTKEEIKERLNQNISGYTKEGIRCVYDKLETKFVERNILEWILEEKNSAMCEANSNAVLAEVRAIIDKSFVEETWEEGDEYCHGVKVGWNDALNILKEKLSEHFS